MRNSKANVCDLPAKYGVSSLMLLSQVRQGIFECPGVNSAGPKRCLCQSLHEYKAEAPTQFWKWEPPIQDLRGICPCKCFWGSLMSQISICAGSALCHFILSVFLHQHMHQGCFFALSNLVQNCLTYSKGQWQNQRSSLPAVYGPLSLHWCQPKKNGKPAGIMSKTEWLRAAFLSPQKLLWAKSNLKLANLPGKTSLLFCR